MRELARAPTKIHPITDNATSRKWKPLDHVTIKREVSPEKAVENPPVATPLPPLNFALYQHPKKYTLEKGRREEGGVIKKKEVCIVIFVVDELKSL